MMKRKVLLILAVPLLFMMSIFFLMSDIKNIPEDPAILVPPVSPGLGSDDRVPPPPPIRNTHKSSSISDLTKPTRASRIPPNPPNHNVDPNPNVPNNNGNNNVNTDNSLSESSDTTEVDPETKTRQQAVKDAYLHGWNSYVRYAWGHDELQPPTKNAFDWLGMGLTIVDSIDTMFLMNHREAYEKARDWIANSLNFDTVHHEISVFETTIRVVGGLVSIYELTGDSVFLEKAKDLGNRLLPAFNTPTGLAYTTINLRTGHATNPAWTQGSAILSECGTLQLEFSSLSKDSGIKEFRDKAMKAYDVLDAATKPDGLYPVYIDSNNGHFRNNRVTLGALGDSYYEYLLKIWILTGKKEDKYRRMYNEATRAVIDKLVLKSTPSGLTYIAEKDGGISHKMDHLVCFAGAMFALGAYHGITDPSDTEEHMRLGKDITATCHEFYRKSKTGLGPEIARFAAGSDLVWDHGAEHYILRPETVESYFVLYWITGDKKYQDWGWEAFQAIEKHCRTPDGYCGVRNVNQVPVEHDDKQQSFFMAETLKYLYLLFSPKDTVSLDKWVFNTEAHPLRVWSSSP